MFPAGTEVNVCVSCARIVLMSRRKDGSLSRAGLSSSLLEQPLEMQTQKESQSADFQFALNQPESVG